LKSLGVGQLEGATRLDMTLNRLKGIVLGKRGMTADTALRLVRSCENVSALSMRMQADWDLHEAVQRETRRAS